MYESKWLDQDNVAFPWEFSERKLSWYKEALSNARRAPEKVTLVWGELWRMSLWKSTQACIGLLVSSFWRTSHFANAPLLRHSFPRSLTTPPSLADCTSSARSLHLLCSANASIQTFSSLGRNASPKWCRECDCLFSPEFRWELERWRLAFSRFRHSAVATPRSFSSALRCALGTAGKEEMETFKRRSCVRG